MRKPVIIGTTGVVILLGVWLSVTYLSRPPASSQIDPPAPSASEQLAEIVEAVHLQEEERAVELDTEEPEVTGNEAADRRLRQLAEARGYRLQPVAERDDLVELSGTYLQPEAAAAVAELIAAAAEADIEMEIIEGWRSVAEQRALFLAALETEAEARIGRSYTPEQIAGGTADVAVNTVLRSVALPGYSRYHTGYALSLGPPLATPDTLTEVYPGSAVARWLAADTYQQPRQVDIAPSYPVEVCCFGPDPRPWEYVWVAGLFEVLSD